LNRRGQLIIRIAVLALLAAPALCGCGIASKPPADTGGEESPLSEEQVRLNLESFDYVWVTVRDRFWDPELLGLDWDQIREKYRERVEQAETMAQVRHEMNEMLELLGQSHFGIIPKDVYENITGPEEERTGAGDAGITARYRDGKALVISVRKDSPAAGTAVSPGWIILEVNGGSLEEKLSGLEKKLGEKPFSNYSINAALLHMLSGPPGDTLSAVFLDAEGEEISLKFRLESRKGKIHRFGYLPEFYVWLDSRTIDGNIGYISFSSFFDPANIMTKFNNAMSGFIDKEGIILDLRGNPGGIGGMAMGMAGWFVEERGRYLGKLTTRDTELKLIINPRAQAFDGKVAVLVDEMSTSASEFLAGGLQAIGAARVFGIPTPGAALPSVVDRLPNGDAFQYVIGNYTNEDGTRLEGRGVLPDVVVEAGREELLEYGDPVLEAATGWINGNPIDDIIE
jgi:carboxyl-terminal processing protease